MAQIVQVLFGHGYHPGHEYEILLIAGGVIIAFFARFKLFHYIEALFKSKKSNIADIDKSE